MTKRLIILLASLVLVVPFLFFGCSGDDGSSGAAGATGATGATGGTGATGPPGSGVVSNEACIVCHGQNNEFQVAEVHEFNPLTGVQNTCGKAEITIDNVFFGVPSVDNTVPVTVAFTFKATSQAGTDITKDIDLRTKAGPLATDNLAFVSFFLAQMPSAINTTTGSNEWAGLVLNPFTTQTNPWRVNRPDGVAGVAFTGVPATGKYSYKFPDNAVRLSDGYLDNVVNRAGIQFSIGAPTSSSLVENAITATALNLFCASKKLQFTSDRRPAANPTLSVVNPIGGGGFGTAPTADYPTKNDVTTAACNNCHDILAIHGGSRRETQLCEQCHNPKLEQKGNPTYPGYANASLLDLVHKIHTAQDLSPDLADFTEVKYPQSPQNCLTCHKGTDPYWKTRPTRYACGSCHTNVNFATGAGHSANSFAQSSDANCTICHPATGSGFGQSVSAAHASKEGAPPTPDNPYVLPGLAVFQYGIDTVTVDNTQAATITFWVKKGVGLDNGDLGPLSFVNFLPNPGDNVAKQPAGTSGGPSFLITHSGSAANPQDYTNWDEVPSTSGVGPSVATGQPKSVSIIGLPITATDNTNTKFKAKLTGTNSFPANPVAKMRAVALQGYFTQTNLDITFPPDGVPDNVARHTPAVAKAVTLDATRRVIVKSGYVNNAGQLVDDPALIATLTPIGCLECHEAFEGHGGNRVNNVQVCVMCHNPQLTSSGRTIPDNVTINPTITTKLGTNPLAYPEVTQSMAELIHGLHGGLGADPAATSSTAAGLRQQNIRVNNFQIVRNRQETPGVYGVYIDSAEVTYPGDLTHCTKCHFAANPGTGNTSQSYKADLPAGVLFSTEKVTTGNASETLSQIVGARQSFQGHDPSGNPTDLVDSPLASKCGYCHDTPAAVGHFLSTGGADIKATRSIAQQTPPPLAPDVTP